MQATDFLVAAQELLDAAGKTKPRQVNLRRACSSVYYALFHTICRTCAGTLSTRAARRAWTQAYRAVEHLTAKNNCKHKRFRTMGFPNEVVDFGNLFVQMQEKRHRADYDPNAASYKSEVDADIKAAQAAIAAFRGVSPKHKRAFATYVLFRSRD